MQSTLGRLVLPCLAATVWRWAALGHVHVVRDVNGRRRWRGPPERVGEALGGTWRGQVRGARKRRTLANCASMIQKRKECMSKVT